MKLKIKHLTTLLFVTSTFSLTACAEAEKNTDEKWRLLNEKAEELNSVVNHEMNKVEQLDTLLNNEMKKINKLDSIVESNATRLDTLLSK